MDRRDWYCSKCCAAHLPFYNLNANDLYVENLRLSENISDDISFIPDENFQEFVDNCNSVLNNIENDDREEDDFLSRINSSYHNIEHINKIKPDPLSSFNIIHTNLASINKHFDDLSRLNVDFHIIGISEHKIRKDIPPTTNIDLPGYHPFFYEPTETSHGGTGFYIKDSFVFKKRDDLNFNSKGDFESCFIELVFPDKKNVVVGCIYRHPSSQISIHQFSSDYIEPMLKKISSDNKTCILVGDFNIDLIKTDINDDANEFFNIMSSYFFTPYILQPSRPVSKPLIDNIFINSVEYISTSGNLTIQLSDHLIQFVILEGFFKEITPRKSKIYERNFKNFNEREFNETLLQINWGDILALDMNDPNLSLNNLYNHVNFLLDEFAPYRKLNKKEIKLKSKPWINKEIQLLMIKRDKLLHQYSNESDPTIKFSLQKKFKTTRNRLTKMKRESKIAYFQTFFESKSAMIWKGIRSLVCIKNSSKSVISLIDDNGRKVIIPEKIGDIFNKYFASVGENVDKKIPITHKNFHDYLKNIQINKSFFLKACKADEIFDIILTFDLKKSLGPNSVPIYLLKIFNNFFSLNLCRIVNLCFNTGIFPDLCKVAKIIPLYKKDDPLECSNYRPISLLPIFSKIIEKFIYNRMYAFLDQNKLIYNRQFVFRSKYSTNHALISLTEYIKTSIDRKLYVAGIFIDLEKAFDTVNHKILCDKLPYYGFRGKIVTLIKSFIENRKHHVSINGVLSPNIEIKCGVPQGSTLGPLLFLLYINDFRFSLQNSLSSHFADDTCIVFSAKTPKRLESVLNQDLKLASNWLNANRLSKCG